MNHIMAQMLAIVVNKRQFDRDLQLPNVEFAYNNSASAAMGLTPTRSAWGDFHISLPQRLNALGSMITTGWPLTILLTPF